MDKRPGDLDEALVKSVVCIGRLQPKILQHIVGFIVFSAIETGEISEVTRVKQGVARLAW